jgi:hypothetical protein
MGQNKVVVCLIVHTIWRQMWSLKSFTSNLNSANFEVGGQTLKDYIRRKEKISWSTVWRYRAKGGGNILHRVGWNKVNWFGHILCRTCLLNHVSEGNIEGTRRRGKRNKPLLHDLKKKEKYCNLKDEALDRTAGRPRWRWGRGPVASNNT